MTLNEILTICEECLCYDCRDINCKELSCYNCTLQQPVKICEGYKGEKKIS